MRRTVTHDDDEDEAAAAAVESLRRETGAGVSEAVNGLVRAGLARKPRSGGYVHRSGDLGLKLDVANIGDVLDLLDGS